jgi:flagellar hook assembly protein FlgD
MKKVIISAALLTVLGADVWASEPGVRDGVTGTVKANVEATSRNGVYNLIYKTASAGTVKVTITNSIGEVVLVDQIEGQGSFLRPYNFLGLPAGHYTVTVLDRNGKTTLPLVHTAGTVNLQPVVQIQPVEQSKYEVRLLGSNADEVSVNIYDAAKRLVYSEQIAQKGSFSRVYDLNKMNLQNVTIEVVNANGVVGKKQF